MRNIYSLIPSIFFLSVVGLVQADDLSERLSALAGNKLKSVISSEIVIDSINKQNSELQDITQSEIDQLDTQWRSETEDGSGSLIDEVMGRAVSQYLSDVLDSEQGLITEIFVMDNHGLNVGQSGLTSDYWQGDESKWQETFMIGQDAVHISDVEFDESSQTYQAQISISVTDPSSGTVIGAATFGINADAID